MKRAPRSLQHHVLYRKYNGQDSEISALLGKCGLRGLYISLDIAGQLADIADDHPFKQFLRDTRAGTVAHRGGDVSVGGFQEGKTRFQIAQIDEWIERSNLSIGEPGYISQEGVTTRK